MDDLTDLEDVQKAKRARTLDYDAQFDVVMSEDNRAGYDVSDAELRRDEVNSWLPAPLSYTPQRVQAETDDIDEALITPQVRLYTVFTDPALTMKKQQNTRSRNQISEAASHFDMPNPSSSRLSKSLAKGTGADVHRNHHMTSRQPSSQRDYEEVNHPSVAHMDQSQQRMGNYIPQSEAPVAGPSRSYGQREEAPLSAPEDDLSALDSGFLRKLAKFKDSGLLEVLRELLD